MISFTFLDCNVPIKCQLAFSFIVSYLCNISSVLFSPILIIPDSTNCSACSIVTYFVTPIIVISSKFRFTFSQACFMLFFMPSMFVEIDILFYLSYDNFNHLFYKNKLLQIFFSFFILTYFLKSSCFQDIL